MPTPVSAARQCLTEEAARALDEAVAVARRRSHAQTTSLHAVSALLGLPSSALRDACARARSSAYSSRLQFRALELCVGVSLDRLQSSKSVEDPPISNSLMAAIKRSQANQRRHPESYHLQQMHNSSNSSSSAASLLKVDLKYFILSILDDPIVSRVFGEAGFRSSDIKLAILHPPMTQLSPRFSRGRCPPIFLCNLTDADLGRRGFDHPLYGCEDIDKNCRRIGEVLARKDKRNPLLVGICAGDTLKSFSECIQRGKVGVLPWEINGLNVISIEKEVIEFVDGVSKEKIDVKLKELGQIVEHGTGPGLIINFGELKVLVSDDPASSDSVSCLVSKLTKLLQIHDGKLWLMGAAASDETYLKFLSRFPTIEKDWDLHLLPITSSKSSFEGIDWKPSLMGSFVPFGGFFSTPSDLKNPLSGMNQSIPRCHLCNEKYEQEVAAALKVGSTISVADQYSASLPSWLRKAEPSTNKGVDMGKAKEDGVPLNAKIAGLQKKWNDICQGLHHIQAFPRLDIPQVRSHFPVAEGIQFAADRHQNSIKEHSINLCATLSPRMNIDMQDSFATKQKIPIALASQGANVNFHSRLLVEVPKNQPREKYGPWLPPNPVLSASPRAGHSTSPSSTSVTTDLGLGTVYASTSQEPHTPKSQDRRERISHYSGSVSAEFDSNSENTSLQIAHSFSCTGPTSEDQLDPRDYKSLSKFLAERVGWQNEAICTISQAVSRYRTGDRRHGSSKCKGGIWLTFLGPDRVGKKKIAAALAERMFGSQENLISVDLNSHDIVDPSDSIFEWHQVNDDDVKFRGKGAVDYVTGELSKKPHSVVFLENVDKADLLAQTSLSQAVRTGKLRDSHGREISTDNAMFVTTSIIIQGVKNVVIEKKPIKFSEEGILGAKSWQMQIQISDVSVDSRRRNDTNVRVRLKEQTSSPASTNKRKLIDTYDQTNCKQTETQTRAPKVPRSYLDLNLPVDDTEKDISDEDCDSDSISENSKAWLEDFFDQVDERVVFNSFNFDVLAEKIMKHICLQLQRILGPEMLLDIDQEVMEQILAATWLADGERAVEDWLEKVLSRGFAEARQKLHLPAQSVVKLVACHGLCVEEQAPGVRLPAKINVN